MPRIMQFAEAIPSNEISFASPCIYEFDSHPLYRPREMMQVVNHGGKIKIHMLVDASKPKRRERVLIIGTGHEVSAHLLESLRCIGHLLMNDGQYGIHVYHIEDHAEAGEETPKKAKLTIEVLHKGKSPIEVAAFEELVTKFCLVHKGKIKWAPSDNPEGPHKLHVLKDAFSKSDEFEDFREQLYKEPAVTGIKFTKLV